MLQKIFLEKHLSLHIRLPYWKGGRLSNKEIGT